MDLVAVDMFVCFFIGGKGTFYPIMTLIVERVVDNICHVRKWMPVLVSFEVQQLRLQVNFAPARPRSLLSAIVIPSPNSGKHESSGFPPLPLTKN
jgi:hypothetical protein